MNHHDNDSNDSDFDNNDAVVDSTSGSNSDDNTDANVAAPNGEYNYGVIASFPVHSMNSNKNSNHDTDIDNSVGFYEGNDYDATIVDICGSTDIHNNDTNNNNNDNDASTSITMNDKESSFQSAYHN